MRASLTVWFCMSVAFLEPSSAAETDGSWSHRHVDAVLHHADSLRMSGKPDSALVILRTLRASRHLAGDIRDEARIALRIGLVLRRLNQPAEAEGILAEAVSLASTVRDTLLWCETLLRQAQAVDAQGRPPRAVPLYERLMELAERAGLAKYVGRADTFLARREIGAGNFDAAAQRLERAIRLFQQLDMASDENGARLFLGICLHRTGQVARARRCWTDALRYAREVDAKALEGNCLNNLGLLEAMAGRPDRAAVHWDEAYHVLRSQNRLRAAIVPASNAAMAFRELGRLEDAQRLLDEQLEIARDFGFRDREASARLSLGEIARDRLRSGEAAEHYRAALRLLRDTDLPALEADALKGLARALDDADSIATAVSLFESRLPELRARLGQEKRLVMDGELAQLLLHAGKPVEVLQQCAGIVAEANEAALSKIELQVLRIEATAYRELGRPDSALVRLRQATAAWETMRSRPDDPAWREQRAMLGSEVHGALADLLLEHPPEVSAAERRDRAFAFLQRFRARTLIERMLGSDTTEPASADTIALSALQKRILAPGEVLLDFHVASDQTLLFAITRDSCRVVRLRLSEPRLRASVGICLELLAAPPAIDASVQSDRALMVRAVASLADALLSGVSDLVAGANRIIFVPDGVLHRVPLRPLLGALSTGAAGAASSPEN